VTSSNEYVIIGIDPGLMTGVFTWHSGQHAPDFATYRALETLSPWFEGLHIEAEAFPDRFWNEMVGWCLNMPPERIHVAIERYIITPKTAKLSQQTDALEVTGMAKAIASIHGVTDVRQYAKANLKFASDDMLRGVGWYSPKMRHANDAARQAFALLKDVDYPRWSELVRDAKMEPTTEG
jgi:hypothetical protein